MTPTKINENSSAEALNAWPRRNTEFPFSHVCVVPTALQSGHSIFWPDYSDRGEQGDTKSTRRT